MNRLPKPTVSRYSPQNNPMTSCLAQGRAKKICTLLMYTMAYITSSVQIYYGTTTMKSGSTKEVFQLLRYSWFVSRSLHNQELHVRRIFHAIFWAVVYYLFFVVRPAYIPIMKDANRKTEMFCRKCALGCFYYLRIFVFHA